MRPTLDLKRTLDVAAALFGLLVLALPLALIALAIWIEDRHSPFYRGRRVARGGREFRMVKFRSMVPDAWRNGVNSTAAGDGRITKVGAWLRARKLDELPQLWNVLSGDMSLVGPRPQTGTDAALYTAEERRLFEARPGITDLASIVFADEGEILSGASDPDLLYNQVIRPWKSRLGLLYIERRTFSADLLLLFLTLLNGFSRRRALAGVAAILESWDSPPLLRRMALRKEKLLAWPAPGAGEVAGWYPRQEHLKSPEGALHT
jgi:lipopolysaccharide/colanic/teichoic acid biosynthesis glycosyltransferase